MARRPLKNLLDPKTSKEMNDFNDLKKKHGLNPESDEARKVLEQIEEDSECLKKFMDKYNEIEDKLKNLAEDARVEFEKAIFVILYEETATLDYGLFGENAIALILSEKVFD